MLGISARLPMIPRPVTTTSWKEWDVARTPEQVEWDNQLAQVNNRQAVKDRFYSDWDEAERWQASSLQVAEDRLNSDWDKTERRLSHPDKREGEPVYERLEWEVRSGVGFLPL